MMKMKRAATLVAIVLPLSLAAGCGMHRRGHVDPARIDEQVTEHLDDYLDDVKASDAQRARIQGIKSRLLPEATALATAQKQVRAEMATQLASERPDPARMHALVDQQLDSLRALAHKAVDGAVEAHTTLTPEQRAPLVKKMRRYASR